MGLSKLQLGMVLTLVITLLLTGANIIWKTSLSKEYKRGVDETTAVWVEKSKEFRDQNIALKMESYRKGVQLSEMERRLNEKEGSKQQAVVQDRLAYKTTKEGSKQCLDEKWVATYNKSL